MRKIRFSFLSVHVFGFLNFPPGYLYPSFRLVSLETLFSSSFFQVKKIGTGLSLALRRRATSVVSEIERGVGGSEPKGADPPHQLPLGAAKADSLQRAI